MNLYWLIGLLVLLVLSGCVDSNNKIIVADLGSSGGTADGNNLLDINAFIGDLNDGDANITGGTTTLAKDMYYRDLNISSSGIIKTVGYRIFARTIKNAGIIDNNGNGTNNAQVRGAGATVAGVNIGGGGAASAGGLGTTGAGACTSAPAAAVGMGGQGGSGGSGGSCVFAGAPTCTLVAITYSPWRHVGWDILRGGSTLIQGGGGGRGGGSGGGDGIDDGGMGGGGGSGGGVLLIYAQDINNTGKIMANGGNGNQSTTGTCGASAGGGGGGGGGFVFIGSKTYVGNLPTASAGTFGTATAGGGSVGTAGTAGKVLMYNFSTGVWTTI